MNLMDFWRGSFEGADRKRIAIKRPSRSNNPQGLAGLPFGAITPAANGGAFAGARAKRCPHRVQSLRADRCAPGRRTCAQGKTVQDCARPLDGPAMACGRESDVHGFTERSEQRKRVSWDRSQQAAKPRQARPEFPRIGAKIQNGREPEWFDAHF